MTDFAVAAPLASALAARGYDTLTDVQAAMLSPESAGRDLLVSAQTGSGKTVAFGMAISGDLLKGAEQFLYADKPLALAIAPTRELALQVARELGWLYENANVQIATCVGGMDYRTEKRALDRGAHIVVGTPGRLRDHIERKSLDLSGLSAVVLDEADEMLDLGFQEDLEFILSASPEERRTLMFSATVPKEIEALARTYQQNALRVAIKSAASQHADIDYRAYSVVTRDRENAIFNILRLHEAKTSIIFCKTRANVNHLLTRMGNRGFQVVALSGELSQQERTHALQALRDGRARVCIATDVAARGIDLPGLELVIHADLPGSSETLLHRSGRTGRAGNKGISALIVPPAEFKKAQRLLQGAKVVAEWCKPPSAEEVQAKDDERLLNHAALSEGVGDDGLLAEAILEKFGADNVAGAFIRLWREGRSAPEVLTDTAPPPTGAAAAPRERGEFGPSVWFVVSVGHSGRAEARWLLPKICEGGGITKNAIGAIRVKEDQTYVQILSADAGKFADVTELDRDLTMTRMAGEPELDRPSRAPAPKRPALLAPRDGAEDRPKRAYSPKPPRIVEDEAGDAPPPRAPRAEEVEYAPRAPRAPRAEKPYAPREAREERPYRARTDSADAPRKPYGDRPAYGAKPDAGERKPYVRKPLDAYDRKPSTIEGDRKPYERKPYEGSKPAGSYDRKPSEGYDRKPRAEGDAPRKPRWKDGAPAGGGDAKPRSAGYKSFGGGEGKPARAGGYKSHGGDDKPVGRPRAAEGGKPAGKSFGAKPFAAKSAAPARPKTDAKDTSKRFVPPKKPRT